VIKVTEKWRLVGGKIYRLASVFVDPREAIALAKELRTDNRVFIAKVPDKKWAVYWRAKEDEIECNPDITESFHLS
jgi:hypothetical protein